MVGEGREEYLIKNCAKNYILVVMLFFIRLHGMQIVLVVEFIL